MQSNTLKGIFPERRVPYKKNYIKENMKRVKEMGVQKAVSLENTKVPSLNVPKLNTSRAHAQQGTSKTKLNHCESENQVKAITKQKGVQRLEIRPATQLNRLTNAKSHKEIPTKLAALSYMESRIINRGIQTEQTDDEQKLYSSGVIKYPSPAVLLSIREEAKKSPRHRRISDHGDSPHEIVQKMQTLDLDDKKDFVNYNANNAIYKFRNTKRDEAVIDPNKPPANYKRGVVPKYIKQQQKKEVVSEVKIDVDCPAGHILLPEEERKETLRVLRESYADKITELNSMPVRSDTLRMQKRKIELEDELKKIDEGIKVFQRPKVFVKINI